MRRQAAMGLAWAAISGLLFGAINVVVKAAPIHPVLQSALAYLGVALVLAPFLRGLRVPPRDRFRMAAMAVLGGAAAPVLLFYGLQRTAAVDAGLLLTLELVATTVLAAAFLGEREGARGWAGLGLLLAASVVVAVGGPDGRGTTAAGALLVALAAVAWGIDNALSAGLVGRYRPAQLLAVKGLVGGAAALAAALPARAPLPGWGGLALALAIGAVGLAGSLACFYGALRAIGAARTSAVNIPMTALAGAAGGALVLGEQLAWRHLWALALLLAGVALLIGPRRLALAPQRSSSGGS